jgi:hypothetical protein
MSTLQLKKGRHQARSQDLLATRAMPGYGPGRHMQAAAHVTV